MSHGNLYQPLPRTNLQAEDGALAVSLSYQPDESQQINVRSGRQQLQQELLLPAASQHSHRPHQQTPAAISPEGLIQQSALLAGLEPLEILNQQNYHSGFDLHCLPGAHSR
jgi:hypothetical protein